VHRLVDFAMSSLYHAELDDVWVSVDVFNVDLQPVFERHAARGSTATLVTAEVSKKVASDKVVVLTGRGGVVRDLEVRVSRPSAGTVATEIFVYRTEALLEALTTLRSEIDDGGNDQDSGLGARPQADDPEGAARGRWRTEGIETTTSAAPIPITVIATRVG
jgi:ADP-glucose pyrophosphorylase